MGPYPERLKDFGLLWRFTDAEKYTQLSDEEFAHFHLLSEEESLRRWATFVYPGTSPTERHLYQLNVEKRIELPATPAFQFPQSDDAEEWDQIIPILKEYNPASETIECLFFWHATIAVKTQWGIFMNHWDDFCYPSDCSNILVFPNMKKTVVFMDERWYFLNRKMGEPLFHL